MSTLLQDLRHSVRLLLKTPGFSATAVLVLALGIGANAAVFTLVNTLLLKPLAGSEQPGQLVGIYSHDHTQPDSYRGFSYPAYTDIRDRATSFSDVHGLHARVRRCRRGRLDTPRVRGGRDAGYFSTLGVRPDGRAPSPRTRRAGPKAQVAVVSYRYWKSHGGDLRCSARRSAQLAAVHDRRHRPARLHGDVVAGRAGSVGADRGQRAGRQRLHDETGPASLADRRSDDLMVIGRLKPGVTAEAAAPALLALCRTARARLPGGEQEPAPERQPAFARVDFHQPAGRRGARRALRHAVGDGRHRAADRDAEPGEHDAGPGHRAAQGDRDASRARRRPFPDRPPAADRGGRALAARRRGRPAARLLGHHSPGLLAPAARRRCRSPSTARPDIRVVAATLPSAC